MTRVSMFSALLLLSACASGPASAPVVPLAAIAPAPDYLALLPPAPVAGSAADKQDIAMLLDLQAKRTQSMCDYAQADVDVSLKRFLAPLGLTLNGDTLLTDQLLKSMTATMRRVSDASKNLYKRPRPYDYSVGLVPCISKVASSSYSYPSGHAAIGYMMAAILAQIIPERRTKWLDRAADFGRSRMIGGVHFPSDVEGGRIIGLSVAEYSLRDPAIRTELDLARPELRRALGY